MKYKVSVGSQTFSVDVQDQDGRPRLQLDGVPQELDAVWSENGQVCSLIIGGESFEAWVAAEGERWLISLDGRRYEITVEDERLERLAMLGRPRHRDQSRQPIKAPMPGLVLAVHVKPGDQVRRGQGLLVLEAMKMENDLSAPRDGVVEEVPVAPGTKVNQGQVLVVIGEGYGKQT